jgi:hypothetical protein
VPSHGVFRVLLGWQRQGERAVAGVPWHFGVAVLQHHRQQEGRAVVVVGVPRHFWGCNVCMTGRVGEWQWARCGVVRMGFLRWR